MPEYVTASIVAGSGLLAQIIAIIRCIIRPDENTGACRCVSGCTEHQLEHGDEHEVYLQKVDLHGREVLVVSAKN